MDHGARQKSSEIIDTEKEAALSVERAVKQGDRDREGGQKVDWQAGVVAKLDSGVSAAPSEGEQEKHQAETASELHANTRRLSGESGGQASSAESTAVPWSSSGTGTVKVSGEGQ